MKVSLARSNAVKEGENKGTGVSNHSHWRLRRVMSSSLRAASQRHLLSMCGSTLKLYLELASSSRSRFLTMVAAVWCRSKFTSRSPSTGGASMKAGF
jgi:aryl-alcohol dehydrogenase-like predicted oxidoreductase